MTALRPLKLISPDTADQLSGYRTAFDYFAGLTPADFSATTRLIIAGIGILAFLVFGWLALKELPRPHLARGELELTEDDRGSASIQPRAIERIAETAATDDSAVTGASGRFGTDDLAVTCPFAAPATSPTPCATCKTASATRSSSTVSPSSPST